MNKWKRTVLVLVLIAILGFLAFRVSAIISGKKKDMEKGQLMTFIPVVEVEPVTTGLVEEKIPCTGDIAPTAQVTIYSKVQGWVDRINCREGDRVTHGEVIVTLDSREAQASVSQARANLDAAVARLNQVRATSEEAVQSQIQQTRANLDLAEADLSRTRELYEKNFIARQQLDEALTRYNVAKAAHDLAMNSLKQKTWENDIALAEAQVRQARANLELAQAQLANLIILSPMNGLVTKRHVDPGTMVKDTTPILTIMDLDEVKMIVNVIEKDLVRLKKGQLVKVKVTAFPERQFNGRISIITPALEINSRTAEIQISIPNPGLILNPGMFGRAEILVNINPSAILIPIQALRLQDGKDTVFVYMDGKAYSRIIEKGQVRDRTVQVISGLNPGEKVIISGNVQLRDGMSVRVIERTEEGKGGSGRGS